MGCLALWEQVTSQPTADSNEVPVVGLPGGEEPLGHHYTP